MTVSLSALRRQLRELQRRFRMQDWAIDVVLVDTIDSDSEWGQAVYDDYDRTAIVKIVKSPPDNTKPRDFVLAHEFAHLLVVDMRECAFYAMRRESDNAAKTIRDRWTLAEERFCNAFAEAATTKEVS